MKPIVFYINENNTEKDKLTITKQELEDMLDKAYQQGREDGSRQISMPYISTPELPHTPPFQSPFTCQPIITCATSQTDEQPNKK